MRNTYFTVYFFYIMAIALNIHSVLIEKYGYHTFLVHTWYTMAFWISVVFFVIGIITTIVSISIMTDDNSADYCMQICNDHKDYIIPTTSILFLLIPIAAFIQMEKTWLAWQVIPVVIGLYLIRCIVKHGYKLNMLEMAKK